MIFADKWFLLALTKRDKIKKIPGSDRPSQIGLAV